ncbi:evolutionarily conserved signaling intermediate in Toll pathway, mitochondrial [Microplitis demolitor]|uniref:evolutionarily conserved signaling intermediate in Toll pathway, mitochondrial n=1 Tax=Microplitis demolitor TaxID=69319 RepID=UPI0004CDAC78|nr:evolutionarily conserved signaling intermediate in Toll pathway, mitochondrial [Microplitis demolitor]
MWIRKIPVIKLLSPPSLRLIKNRVSRSPGQLSAVNRFIHTTVNCGSINEAEQKDKKIALFDAARVQQKKEKSTFLAVLYAYQTEGERKTGHVQFVYAALRYMKEFGVADDLEAYKAVLNTLPKGRFVAKNLFQAEMFHYPREQQCGIDVLQQMEDNGVMPDPEMELMILNIYGQHGFPLRKLRRMAYWQGKFKNLNPWPYPRPLPSDRFQLAMLAIKKIASVDVQSTITVFDTDEVENSIDKTWIISASSPDQERLISKHPLDKPAFVEGPFRIWVSKASVDYFLLHTEPPKRPSLDEIDNDDVTNMDINLWRRSKRALALYRCIHEQDNQTIFGVCATGTSTKDSLLSWIRCLQPRNPALEKIPILFKFTSMVNDKDKIEAGPETEESKKKVSGENIDKLGS